MEKSNKIIREIGECFCLKSPYKHFIIASLEESIQKREEDIDIIKKGGKDMKKIKIIMSTKQAEGMIDFHMSIKEELTKVRNMVQSIPDCKT